MVANTTVIEVTVGELAGELACRGVSSDERVTVTLEAELIAGRRASRARVVSAGLTDADIDRLIKDAQREVEPAAERGS